MKDSAPAMLRYIQESLYNGKQPDQDGFFRYTKKELSDNAEIAQSTVNRQMNAVLDYLQRWCDFGTWAKYPEYAGEVLYVEVSYQKGVLQFKRNPLTEKPELSFLWALPPLSQWFAYDFFDDKHRRRFNGHEMKYDAIPWSWDADQYEEELKAARQEILNHWQYPKNDDQKENEG